jgi:putative nucleotidyltransferase with HDIG domain
MNRYLPHVAVATLAVLGLPALAASAVQAATGLPPVAGVAIAVSLSLGMAAGGAGLWMRHPGSRDLIFGDLMVWGWLRRVRGERRLAEAKRVLGGTLSTGDRAKVLEQLASGLEARDLYTHGHSRRVMRHAEMIALKMGLAADEVAKVRTAAALHDVGKILTPRDVLLKPGRLTDVEFEVVKRHPTDGAGMVAELGDREVTAIVRHHHERLDSSGYPYGLGAADIPLGSRIVAVADTFDAMTSTRPYRPARSHKRAMDTLAAEAGTRLDGDAVAAFRANYSRRWPVAWWSLTVTLPQRLVSWAGGAL